MSLERLIVSARSVAESVAEIPRVAAQNTTGCASAALDYATRGWRVIPLHSPTAGGCSCGKTGCEHAGKHPRTKNGSKDGSSDPKTTREWWKLWPDANVGIVTGPESGFFVLDVDGEQGERSLAAWNSAMARFRIHSSSIPAEDVTYVFAGSKALKYATPRAGSRRGWIFGDGGYL